MGSAPFIVLVILGSSEAGHLLLSLESIWPHHITGTSPVQYRLLSEGQDTQPKVLSHGTVKCF